MLISLDPGRAGLGWAAFSSEGKLVACGVVKQPKGPRDYEQASLAAVAENAQNAIWNVLGPMRWTLSNCVGDGMPDMLVDSCVVERMTSYPGKGAYAANDLLDLQAIGGMVAGALCPLSAISWLRSQEWKGSVDTEVIAEQMLSWLDASELPVWLACKKKHGKLSHNAADALALGLVHLKRWRIR